MVPTCSYGRKAAVPVAATAVAVTLVYEIFTVARAQAVRRGLSFEDAEDCGMEFVAHMLRDEGRPAVLHAGMQQSYSAAWLRRCAANFAHNARRASLRRGRRERPWPQIAPAEGSWPQAWDGPGGPATVEADLLRGEFWQRIHAATAQLPPAARDLFTRHFVELASVQELAAASGRTPNAVRQALWALRRRLRALLEAQGLNEAEARDYLQALAPQEEPVGSSAGDSK